MTFLWIIPGCLLPTIGGWLLLRLVEGKNPVLLRSERWILGCVLGLTVTMFLTFLAHTSLSLPLTRWGYLLVQIVLVTVLGMLWHRRRMHWPAQKIVPLPKGSFPRWAKVTLGILCAWTAVKILATSTTFLLLVPSVLDDTVDNWNLRGKIFFTTHELTLELPAGGETTFAGGVSSYPPTVSLVKAWFASLAGTWDEGLVNGVHIVWYLAALALLFFVLRRTVSLAWALLGTYILGSLPLYLMHGTNAYADVFLSVHIFASVSLLFLGLSAGKPAGRASFLRLSALVTALLPLTKNEGLMIHFPVVVVLTLITLLWMRRTKTLPNKDLKLVLGWMIACAAVVIVPWVSYKLFNNLNFGNAQVLSNLEIAWQKGVFTSIFLNTFMEGNWLFFCPIFVGLLIWRWREAFRTALVIPAAFVVIVYCGQLPLYFFTYLSTEAIWQTGYARGIVHIVPVCVLVMTVLLERAFSGERR